MSFMTRLRSFSTLQWALGVSLMVHVGLMTLRFVDPDSFNRVFEDTPLEVILVNASTKELPSKAQAIAQANLAGGGEVERGRATSPLPPALARLSGQDISLDQERQERQLRDMQEQQALLLAQLKQALTAMPPPLPRQSNLTPELVEREQKRQQLIKLLAEIERRINLENSRPRKRYISPATREVPYAVYYDQLRRAIEDKGTANFPHQGGSKLYGELTMIVTVNHDGRLLSTQVVQSSGVPLLDRRAQAIVKSAAPFGPFSAPMRRQADLIALVSRFKFTRDDTLQTQLSNN